MSPQASTYQVIPRKFRPQTFESVVGQEAIVTTLKNALRFQRLAHAYLFCGCRGTGKTTLARVFAKALNCQSLTETLEPCNTCPSCLEIMSGRSLDVLEIDGASNRGIDDIRQINETIGYAPASGKFKIYIIDEVHMLTKEAFNALLKTLEEPPANVKFFFATTEPHKVLPTIISRCQRFDLNRIPLDAMQSKLSYIAKDLGVACEEEALSLIAHLSEGSLRDAESLFDQVICYCEQPIKAEGVSATLGLMPKESFFALDEAIAEQRCSFAFDLSQTIFTSGKDLSYFLDNLLEHFRTLLQIKFHKPSFFLNAIHQERYQASATHYTEEQCLYILDYLIQWQQQIAKSPFKRIGLEMILLHLIRSKNRIPFSSLVKKLSEMQGQPSPAPQMAKPAPIIEEKPAPQMAKPEPIIVEKPAPQMAKPEPIIVEKPAPQMAKPAPIIEEAPAPEPAPAAIIEEAPAPIARKTSIEEMLFNKVKSRLDAPIPESAPEPVQAATATMVPEEPPAPVAETTEAPPPSRNTQSRYETLVRFASVELEGIVKKET